MRQKRRHSFLIYLSLAAYLAAGLVDLNEVVLCFGEDGHVAVERATIAGRCEIAAPLPDHGAQWADTNGASACHCGPCVDVALVSIDAPPLRVLSSQDQTLQAKPLQGLPAPPFFAPAGVAPTQRPSVFLAPLGLLAHTSLQSIILLI